MFVVVVVRGAVPTIFLREVFGPFSTFKEAEVWRKDRLSVPEDALTIQVTIPK